MSTLGLSVGVKQMFTKANGAKAKHPKVVFLITDGAQTKLAGAKDPAKFGDTLRKMGVNVIVIGVGPATKKAELDKIGGGSSQHAKTFDELLSKNYILKIKKVACKKTTPKGE